MLVGAWGHFWIVSAHPRGIPFSPPPPPRHGGISLPRVPPRGTGAVSSPVGLVTGQLGVVQPNHAAQGRTRAVGMAVRGRPSPNPTQPNQPPPGTPRPPPPRGHPDPPPKKKMAGGVGGSRRFDDTSRNPNACSSSPWPHSTSLSLA